MGQGVGGGKPQHQQFLPGVHVLDGGVLAAGGVGDAGQGDLLLQQHGLHLLDVGLVDGEGHSGIAAVKCRVDLGEQERTPLRGVGHGDLPVGLVGDVVENFVRFFFHIDHLVGGGQIDFPREGGDHHVAAALEEGQPQLFLQPQKLLV